MDDLDELLKVAHCFVLDGLLALEADQAEGESRELAHAGLPDELQDVGERVVLVRVCGLLEVHFAGVSRRRNDHMNAGFGGELAPLNRLQREGLPKWRLM